MDANARTPADIAHAAVASHQAGRKVTPATITADLIAQGATPAQAATVTKMAVALIPTVTAASLAKWKRAA